MADTLTETVRLQSIHDVGEALDSGPGGATLALAGNKKMAPTVFNIGTSEETFVIATIFPDAGSNAHYTIKNLDPTNYVELGYSAGDVKQRISKGMATRSQLSAGTEFRLKANSSACDVEISMVNA